MSKALHVDLEGRPSSDRDNRKRSQQEKDDVPFRASDRDVVGLWTRLHAAEEALLYAAPPSQLMQQGLFDEMRLRDARIERADDFRHLLRRAVAVLGGAEYLTVSPAAPSTPPAVDLAELQAFQATTVLRGVRRTINEFRDSRRGGLLRARNSLSWTGLLTGATAYALLAIAIVVKVDTSFVIAAVAFYLVAAMIGLFNQLWRSSRLELEQTEEDYGFARAQLLYLPVLAGLAGVGGVVVTAMLFAALNGSVVQYSVPNQALSAATSVASPATSEGVDGGTVDSGGD